MREIFEILAAKKKCLLRASWWRALAVPNTSKEFYRLGLPSVVAPMSLQSGEATLLYLPSFSTLPNLPAHSQNGFW